MKKPVTPLKDGKIFYCPCSMPLGKGLPKYCPNCGRLIKEWK